MVGGTSLSMTKRRWSRRLKDAAFVDVEAVKPGESSDERLRGIEQHGKYVGSEQAMRYETMVLEAVKT